ncbi:MAG: ATP-sensitive inward rectifier potassium channel 10 [Bdellovibrionaceae bacterium]|nr:ATP-sensitive inward rectifier potassium channel 10 [Pseudobdellovibrionaceae bacterium]
MKRTIQVKQNKSNTVFTDVYYDLLSIGWMRFLFYIFSVYFFINLIFGLIYFLSGPEGLSGNHVSGTLNFFTQCFFFSVQTFSTIGYGGITPVSFFTNSVVSIQALVGMLSIGLTSGLFFVRFTRPSAKLIFSEQILISNHRGKRSLIFRLANSRINTIINAQVNVTVMLDEKTPEGMNLRILKDLKLIRNFNAVFFLNWLVFHEINNESPLYNLSHSDLESMNGEFMVSFSGTDQTFSQSIHAAKVYSSNQIHYDRHFEDMLIRDGHLTQVDLDKISKLKD